MFTDHVALKLLLCTPQPSGKLARWGMAIQELNLHIHHQSGKKNTNADALSRYPVSSTESASSNHQALEVVAATSPSWESAKGGETTLSTLQRADPQLAPVVEYLEKGEFLERAHELPLTKSQYTIVDSVLYELSPKRP